MDVRDQRALILAATCQIERKGAVWLVPSQTTSGRKYQVRLEGDGSCTCLDHTDLGQCCKHIRAVKLILRRELGESQIAGPETVTFPEPKKYERDHAAFNAAQSVEKDRLQVLLKDLCSRLPEPESKKRGRKRHSIKDAIFSMVLKVYATKASRTTSDDLRTAFERGYTSRRIGGMKVCSFFLNPDLTPILHALVRFSALPLKVVETKFAIDSTGFSSSKFERWFDHQYGVTRRKCVWVKAHVAVGVKTNVITAVRILDKDAADSPQFKPLLEKTTAAGFFIEEVSADKAYLSAENIEAVFMEGGTPFIMPKLNTTGGIGGLFEKMYHFFLYKQEEFLQHYHQRSNVETAFSMIKRKYGDYVRNRTQTAMVNEVLCKFICHNLCVLNQEQHELGIEPIFWGEEKQPTVPPAARRA